MLVFTIPFGGLLLMMGHQSLSEALFYYFRLEDQVPENHLLRLIDRHVNFEFIRAKLKDSYSDAGRPSIDPELLLRLLLVGYLYGVTSERNRELVMRPSTPSRLEKTAKNILKAIACESVLHCGMILASVRNSFFARKLSLIAGNYIESRWVRSEISRGVELGSGLGCCRGRDARLGWLECTVLTPR